MKLPKIGVSFYTVIQQSQACLLGENLIFGINYNKDVIKNK